MMKKMKKVSALLLAFLIAFSTTGCSTNYEEEQKEFDAFIDKQFVEAMESDYTTMHVYLEHPDQYGVDTSKVEVNLGTRVDEKSQKEALEKAEKNWSDFEKFKRSHLTDEQKKVYDTYEYQEKINKELSDEKFDYYQQLFGSMTGVHYQLPTLFSDWTLRDEQDVKDLILLVKDVKPYMDSIIKYTRTQAEKGLLMTDTEDVKKYCDNIIKAGENSSVLASMSTSIDALKLDDDKTNQYKKELKDAFTSSFLPAYKDISKLMEDVKNANNNEGYAKFKNGKEYYALLLKANIGSDKSVDDVKKMMSNDFDEKLEKMQKLMMKNPKILEAIMGDLPTTSFKSYKEILDDIRPKLSDDFPKVNDLTYEIKPINEEIASESGVAAYFNVPPLDGTTPKQLRVNPKTGDINTITTYHTVAHEGFPGHMFQYAYMYESSLPNWCKTMASSSAYTEGWAVYSQYYAFKYLTDIDQDLLEVIKLNELASYSAVIVADIGIHYEGWDFKQFSDYFNNMGLTADEDSMKQQYAQLQANPAAFEPYYVGYKEFSTIKEKAQKDLGDKFKDKDFHEALLKSGNAPFSVVQSNVDDYVKNTK